MIKFCKVKRGINKGSLLGFSLESENQPLVEFSQYTVGVTLHVQYVLNFGDNEGAPAYSQMSSRRSALEARECIARQQP